MANLSRAGNRCQRCRDDSFAFADWCSKLDNASPIWSQNRVQAYPSSVDSNCGIVQLDGQPRFQHTWTPETTKPWAILTIVHGFGDHGGRFAGMGTSLASLGIRVYATDLVGHGRSHAKRKNHGRWQVASRKASQLADQSTGRSCETEQRSTGSGRVPYGSISTSKHVIASGG